MSTTNYFTSNDLLFKAIVVTDDTIDITTYLAKDKIGYLSSSLRDVVELRHLTKKEFSSRMLFPIASFHIVEKQISFEIAMNHPILIHKLHEIMEQALKDSDFIKTQIVCKMMMQTNYDT